MRAVYRLEARMLLNRVRSWWRRVSWRVLRIPRRPMLGWKALVHDVVSVQSAGAVWTDGTHIGAPAEWTAPNDAVDDWTGLAHDPDPLFFMVKCARCGAVLSPQSAGMRSVFDVPACIPCRPLVRRQVEE